MNQYGRFAEQSWQMLAPARYAALEDPNHFFSTLGQEAQSRVVWLAEQMQGPDPTGETYWEKVGRLNAIRMQAEEIVRADLLMPDSSLWEEEDEDEGLEHLRPLMEMYAEEQREMDEAQMRPMTDDDY